ncbi:hypothetical protein EKL30_15280 [Candidimonas sp. SYP-B2681]|uniref:hypothetical protein n=1 Tax=Candidimonas sp. SYP-B2681 TaxID=2497686 RepID=UPI000F861EB0|nr:hypothetical protein [Candidimonas sp. SYP-B2681]RTZ41050.1 hypothetical protein EKL30_15280 [Candidimonas sp. SYP-B2681]
MGVAGSFIIPLSSTNLVFGLEWLPLLGGRADRTGLRLARLHRATHMVLAGDSAGSVGVVTLKSERQHRKKPFHSAAQNVAQLFATGTIALLLDLERVGFWLVAVHEGAVIARTDRLYRSRNDAGKVLEELHQAYPQIVLLGSPEAPDLPDLDALEAASSAHSQLFGVGRWNSLLPWPVQCFVLALLLVLLIPRVWQFFQRDTVAASSVQAADPRLAWQNAIERSAHNHFVHGIQGTRVLLDTLYELPTRVSGWNLRQAECLMKIRQWQCQARYERLGIEASNSEFLAQVPAGWSVDFVSLDRAQPSWHIDFYGAPLSAVHLKTSANNERDLFSALQAIRPAFGHIQIGKPTALSVSVPVDANGKPLLRPREVLHYFTRRMQVNGPLRSGSLLLPHTASVAWNKVALTVQNIETPGLKSSSLNLSLEGVLYEIEAHPEDSSPYNNESFVAFDSEPAVF